MRGEGCFRDEPPQSPTGRGLFPGRTLSVAYGDSSPEGRALGKEGKFRSHQSTAGRSQPLSCKLFALGKEGRSRPHRSTAGRSLPLSSKLFAPAKASPFRERWHGEAVTERVTSKTPSRRLQQEASYPLQTQKARRKVLQRAFDGSCGVAALSAAQQCLTPARPGPGWWNARSPSLPHGGCPRYGAWPPGSSLP